MFKKITKILLAASLAFSCMVCLIFNNNEVKASEVQPRAQLIDRSFDGRVYNVPVTINGTTYYAKMFVEGSYRHVINSATSQSATNINIRNVLQSYKTYVDEVSITTGNYNLELYSVSYRAVNYKLQITYTFDVTPVGGGQSRTYDGVLTI